MSQPTASDLHVNQPLTNLSLAFLQSQDMFVADKVFPLVPSMKQSDLYYTYDRGHFNRDQMQKRAPGTESAGGGYTVSTDSFYCNVWALHKDVSDQHRANADSMLQLDRDATNWLTLQSLIRKEKDFVSNFFAGGLWTYDYDGVAAAPGANEVRQWNDYTNSDPIVDIRAGRTAIQQLTGFRANVLTVGQPVWDVLVDHPAIIDRIKYGQTAGAPANVTKQAVAALLELDEINVAGSIENTANEGAANSHSFIAGKKALLSYRPPSAGLLTASAGYCFYWSDFYGVNSVGSRIKRFRMEQLASDRIEIEAAFAYKLVSADLGAFWDTVIA